MNYLELCQAVRREAGIAGTGPVSVLNQTGMYDKVVRWVNRAWLDIQALHPNWNFLLSAEQTANLVIGTGEYTASTFGLTDWAAWSFADMRVHDTTQGFGTQVFLKPLPWDRFRDRYTVGVQNAGVPAFVSEDPTNRLRIGPAPSSGDFQLTYRYFKAPVALVANTDVPACPARFHEVIVHLALTYYATHENAPEVYAEAQRLYDSWLGRMLISELPSVQFAYEALA